MPHWSTLLTNLSWFGPFAFVAIFYAFELMRPRIARAPDEDGWLKIEIGIAAFLVSLAASVTLQTALVETAYKLQITSVAEWPIPDALKFVISIALIDFAGFANHTITHKIGWLWRLHKLHHADRHVTASTGLLHHPLESLWIFAVMMMMYVMFGLTFGAILVYSACAAFHSIYSHANVAFPDWLNRPLSWIIFTPDQHRIHHSTEPDEENSNFGQIFIIWDIVFGTYKAAPERDFADFEMGLPGTTLETRPKIWSALKLPFAKNTAA